MSGTMAANRRRTPAVVSVIGIVLLAAGVLAAIIIRVVTMASAASGPMQTLPVRAYTSYVVGPATPLANPYALNDSLVLIAFGVALQATRRRSH